jgi:hypothetical protein
VDNIALQNLQFSVILSYYKREIDAPTPDWAVNFPCAIQNDWKTANLPRLYSGADPVVLLTDELNLALVGGSGGKFWNLGPQKCDFLRSEGAFLWSSHIKIET